MRSPQTDKLSGRAEAAWVLLNANMGDIWVPLRMTLFTVLSAMRPDKERRSLTGGEQKTKLIDYGQSPNNAETGTGPM